MSTRNQKRAHPGGGESSRKKVKTMKPRVTAVETEGKHDTGVGDIFVSPEVCVTNSFVARKEDALQNYVVLNQIFQNLTKTDLEACCEVNKLWRRVASPLIHHFKIELIHNSYNMGYFDSNKWPEHLMVMEESVGYDKSAPPKMYKILLRDIITKLEEAKAKKNISIELYLRGITTDQDVAQEFFTKFGSHVLSFGIYDGANMAVRKYLKLITDFFPNVEHLNCTTLELWDNEDDDEDDVVPINDIYPDLPTKRLNNVRSIIFDEYCYLSVADVASILSLTPNVTDIIDLPLNLVRSIDVTDNGPALRSVLFPHDHSGMKFRCHEETFHTDIEQLAKVGPKLHYFNIARNFEVSRAMLRAYNKHFKKIMDSSTNSLKRLTIQPTEAFSYHQIPRLESLEILEFAGKNNFHFKSNSEGYRYFPQNCDLNTIFPNVYGVIINFVVTTKTIEKHFPLDQFGPKKFGPTIKYLSVSKIQPLCLKELAYHFPNVKHLEVDTDVLNFKFLLPIVHRMWPDLEELTLNLPSSDNVESKNKENQFLDSTITGIPEKICEHLRHSRNRRKYTNAQIEKSRRGVSLFSFKNLKTLNLIMTNPHIIARCCNGRPHAHTYLSNVASKYGFKLIPHVKVFLGIVKNHRFCDELIANLKPLLPTVELDDQYIIPTLTSLPSRAGKIFTPNLLAFDMVSVFIQGIEHLNF